MKRLSLIIVYLMTIFSLTACDPLEAFFGVEIFGSDREKKISHALKTHFEGPICNRYSMIYPFDLAPIPVNKQKIKQADMLVEDDLLKKEEKRRYFKGTGYLKVFEYSLTPRGAKYLNEDHEICYGQKEVSDILDLKEISPTSVSVTFTLRERSEFSWAHDENFKGFARLNDPKTMRRMVYKKSDGQWSVGR